MNLNTNFLISSVLWYTAVPKSLADVTSILQTEEVGSSEMSVALLKTEAVGCFETQIIICQNTQCHNLVEGKLAL